MGGRRRQLLAAPTVWWAHGCVWRWGAPHHVQRLGVAEGSGGVVQDVRVLKVLMQHRGVV